jgi:hypothetical protein
MPLDGLSVRERGQILGIAGLVFAVIPAFAWFPFNLVAAGLASALAVAAVLHGERVFALTAPVVVAVVLLLFNTFTLGRFWVMSYLGNPLPLLMVMAFVAAPFGALAYDMGRAGGGPGSGRAGSTNFLKKLQNLASRFGRVGPTAGGPKLSLLPVATGRPFSVDYQDMARGRVVTLGRTENNDVVVRDSSVSRHHARIAVVQGLGAAICDLGSVNGTFVDDQRVGGRYVPLSGVRTIRLGTSEIAVSLQGHSSERRPTSQL